MPKPVKFSSLSNLEEFLRLVEVPVRKDVVVEIFKLTAVAERLLCSSL